MTFTRSLSAFAKRVAVPLALGALAFFGVTGGRILAPRNIAWLAERDPSSYFLSWHFFRNTPWGFPLGANPRYGAELGSSIAYADALPLFAIPLKAVNAWLPSTFQYFGIWLLCCFVLQAWFAWLLLGLLTDRPVLRACGTTLFLFAPPFLWRLQGHYQLEGQWLVLAALYLCFGPRRLARGMAWPLLVLTVCLVHSYLTAMVLGLWLSDWLRRVVFEARTRADFVQLALVPCLALLALWQAGMFMVGSSVMKGTAGDYPFGYHRMNLTSLFDSSGWSYFLPDLREAKGDYEGFNYLGLGGILLLLAALPALKGALAAVRTRRRYWPLLALLIALTLFAISNNIGFADHSFVIALPQSLLERAAVLRSCGRMFWPVFYVLFWVAMRALIKRYPPRVAAAILGAAVLLQAVDTSAGWAPIRADLLVAGSTWSSPLKSRFWASVPANYREIRLVPTKNQPKNFPVFMYFAARHGMTTDAVYLGRVDGQKMEDARRAALRAVNDGQYAPGALYIVDRRYEAAARSSMHDADLLTWVDRFLVLAPNWKCRPECRTNAGAAPDCNASCPTP
jgi:Family of unknown function (DUF6311)